VLTYPAGWGPVRRLVLTDAAEAAGLDRVSLVAEPVAAAHHFVEVLGHQIPSDRALVVYDFGAGTFDVSIVRPRPGGLDVVSFDGLNVGGLDVDAAVVDWIGHRYGSREPAAWARLTAPRDAEDLRQRYQLWEDVRIAKEMLSRAPSVPLRVPLLGLEAPLTRPEFDEAVQPLVGRTVRATVDLIRAAGLAPEQLAGVVLVGGSSRVPLVATALHRALGLPATVTEQPELVVAEGSLYAVAPGTTPAPRPVAPSFPAAAVTTRRPRPLGWLAAAAAVLVLLLGVGTVWQLNQVSHGTPAVASGGRTGPEAGSFSAPVSDSPGPVPSTTAPTTAGQGTRTGRPSGSSAQKLYKVPRVLGLHEGPARQALLDAGFPNVSVTYTYNPGLTPGFVIDCVPADGTYASPTTTIKLTVTIAGPSPTPSPSPTPGW
jgi:actin-like ATPase involved in cell morphogenesis